MSSPSLPRVLRRVAPTTLLVLALAACARDEITAPQPAATGSLTVDASAGWVYLSLGDQHTVVLVDPASSAAWDIGFNTTQVAINGGTAGPGGVTAFCLCQNSATDPSPEEILAMTPASELADFESVTAASVPDDATFSADPETGAFAVHPWYRYNLAGDHVVSPTFDVYLLRRGDVVYKVQLTGYYGPAGQPRHITVRYARIAG
ncbi:MAG TPA: HmuY family protein [Gemmatimonadaceae bacterium]|nr:HmuY family protein [Gemmatimonadaceae bacterium]